MNQLFQSYDFHQNIISLEEFKKHNTSDNAWVLYENKIFSIQKDDKYLLDIFYDYYGKDTTSFIQTLNKDIQNDIYNRLKDRIIGIIH